MFQFPETGVPAEFCNPLSFPLSTRSTRNIWPNTGARAIIRVGKGFGEEYIQDMLKDTLQAESTVLLSRCPLPPGVLGERSCPEIREFRISQLIQLIPHK